MMKSLAKKIAPTIYEYARTHKRAFLDSLEQILPTDYWAQYLGFDVSYHRGDRLIARLEKEPVFEEKLCKAIAEDLDGGDFVDVGANIGLISLYVERYTDSKIDAFECGPDALAHLVRTLLWNDLRLNLHPYALGDKSVSLLFETHLPKYSSNDGIRNTGKGGKTKKTLVNMRTLDSFDLTPKVIKIDTEGAELWVLEGAQETLKKHRPIVYFEMGYGNLHVYPYTADDILSFLNGLGYTVYTFSSPYRDITPEKVTKENLHTFLGDDIHVDTFKAVYETA